MDKLSKAQSLLACTHSYECFIVALGATNLERRLLMLITDAGDGYVYIEFPASQLVGKLKSGEFITYSDRNGLKNLRRLLHAEEVDSFVKRRCPALSEAVSGDKTLRKIRSGLEKGNGL